MSQPVGFENAKLAYQLGYNVTDKGRYCPMYCVNGELTSEKLGYQLELPQELDKGFILAPMQSILQKWLRDNHNLDLEVMVNHEMGKKFYSYLVLTTDGRVLKWLSKKNGKYDNYEIALEEGLIEALEILRDGMDTDKRD